MADKDFIPTKDYKNTRFKTNGYAPIKQTKTGETRSSKHLNDLKSAIKQEKSQLKNS